AHLDVRLVHPDHEALVQVAVDLLVDRGCGEAVARVLAPEAAGKVDVLAPVDIPDPCTLGSSDDERGRGDAAGDVSVALCGDPFGRCPLADGHQCFRSRRMSAAARSPVSTA